jgi:DNA-binding Lrp family transcriptional regulator
VNHPDAVDETDIRICQMLMRDSRLPYRELIDALRPSMAAVHARVERLVLGRTMRRNVLENREGRMRALYLDLRARGLLD